jgi:hypothetical protein
MNISKLKCSLLALLSGTVMPVVANAVTIAGNVADRETLDAAYYAGSVDAVTMRAGSGGVSAPYGRTAVFVFQLPDIDPADIKSVTFSVTLLSFSSVPSFNLDLYALDARVSPDVLTTDYYAGPTPDTAEGVTLIQESFATSSSPVGTIGSSGAGTINLTDFVKEQLSAGNAGEYIFLMLCADVNISGFLGGYNFASANNTSNPIPELDITLIPEASGSSILLGSGILSALVLNRMRRQRK